MRVMDVDPRQQEDGCFLLTPACDELQATTATATGAAGRPAGPWHTFIHAMGPPPRRALTTGHASSPPHVGSIIDCVRCKQQHQLNFSP
jgi:hypothetical protein